MQRSCESTVRISYRITTPGTGAYNASKYAIESLADALRIESRPWRIPVSPIEPGPIRTDMWADVLANHDRMAEKLTADRPEVRRSSSNVK
ncbi:MAG: SDR family NAD(P)-dependent oxidoreductase [Candidatus Nanopelagicales bacterium]